MVSGTMTSKGQITIPREVHESQVLDALRRVAHADHVRVERAREVGRALELADGGADFAEALIDSVSRADGTGVVTMDRRASDRLGWELVTGPT